MKSACNFRVQFWGSLQEFIERSVVMTAGEELRAPITELRNQKQPAGDDGALADANRAYIMATLGEPNGILGGRNGATARLGLPRTTLLSRMQKPGSSRDIKGPRPERWDSQRESPATSLPFGAREKFTASAFQE